MRALLSLWMVYGLRPWRPLHRLRGPPPPLWQGRLEIRSVPLRGYGFEISSKKIKVEVLGKMFPSPCGDMVLKFASKVIASEGYICFRPLTGIWF